MFRRTVLIGMTVLLSVSWLVAGHQRQDRLASCTHLEIPVVSTPYGGITLSAAIACP